MSDDVDLQTSQQVADALGVRRTTILYHANRRSIGHKLGRDRLFTPTDVTALRQYVGRPPGRVPTNGNDGASREKLAREPRPERTETE